MVVDAAATDQRRTELLAELAEVFKANPLERYNNPLLPKVHKKQLAFHANLFQIDGGGLSRGALYNFLVVSGIEALPTTRLYEMWFEPKWGTKLAVSRWSACG